MQGKEIFYLKCSVTGLGVHRPGCSLHRGSLQWSFSALKLTSFARRYFSLLLYYRLLVNIHLKPQRWLKCFICISEMVSRSVSFLRYRLVSGFTGILREISSYEEILTH